MNYKFDDMRIIIAEGNPDVRRGILSILKINGFRDVSDAGNLGKLIEHIERGGIDVIMADHELPGGDPCDVIKAVREERLGDDPFLPFVLIAETISEDNVRKVVDSGVDHVLKRPISTSALLDRVRELIENRKPFAVTQTYVGPDRRAKDRSNLIGDKLVIVPNKLRAKAHGDKKALERIEMDFEQSKQALKTVRVLRYGLSILNNVNELLVNVKAGHSEKTAQLVSDSIDLMTEASQRLEGTQYEETASEVFPALRQTLHSIQERGRLNEQDRAVLMPLSASLAKVFLDEETTGQHKSVSK
jgi:DNA-binding response OmpR family regulator